MSPHFKSLCQPASNTITVPNEENQSCASLLMRLKVWQPHLMRYRGENKYLIRKGMEEKKTTKWGGRKIK